MCNRLPAWPQNFGRSSDCESSVAVRVGHERRLNQAQLVAVHQKPFTEAKAVLSGQMATMLRYSPSHAAYTSGGTGLDILTGR